jgi:hypothetical protein
MPITNPPDLSRAALEAWAIRFNDPSKGFNAQYAQTRLIAKYAQLPPLIIDGNYTVPPLSTNFLIGKYDIDWLISNSVFTPPGFQIYTENLMGRSPTQQGMVKNRQFGGICTITIDVHLTWRGPPNIPPNYLIDPELLLSSIEVTLSASFCTPYAASNTYQSWPPGINFVPHSLSRIQTSPIRTGGLGLMQLARFRCIFDLQL